MMVLLSLFFSVLFFYFAYLRKTNSDLLKKGMFTLPESHTFGRLMRLAIVLFAIFLINIIDG